MRREKTSRKKWKIKKRISIEGLSSWRRRKDGKEGLMGNFQTKKERVRNGGEPREERRRRKQEDASLLCWRERSCFSAPSAHPSPSAYPSPKQMCADLTLSRPQGHLPGHNHAGLSRLILGWNDPWSDSPCQISRSGVCSNCSRKATPSGGS